jgi:hypothetical protein
MAKVSVAYRDQLPSSPRNLRNDHNMKDDDNSVSSTASSVHEIIVFETDRRKEKIHRIRLRRKIAQLLHSKTANQDDPVISSGSAGGIMSVRTLDESLHGTKISEIRKLRRKMTIKVKNLDGSHSTATGNGISEDTDDISEISGLSNLSLSTAGNSSLNVNVKLGFSHVHIREYVLVPGTNPSVSSGPPIELGWAHTEPTSVELEKWESIRDGRRRLQAQMRIPPHVRRELLLHHGNPQRDIRDATRNAATGRKQRMQTLDRLHHGNVNEMVDTVKRAFNIKKAFKKKKAEKDLYGS